MFFQLGEEIECIEGLQLVEVGAAQLFENFAIKSGEEHLLIAVLVHHVGGAGGKRLAEFVLALLVSPQNFAGAFNHAAGKTGEPRHFDAVTLVRASGLDAAQKNDLAGRFFHGDVNILHRGEKIAKFRQLVVVRGEERARARVLLEMFNDGPGDGKTIERSGAPAHFIEEDETRRSGVIQDGGDFAHFDKKSRAPAGEIVARANAREDAVGDRQLRLSCRPCLAQ